MKTDAETTYPAVGETHPTAPLPGRLAQPVDHARKVGAVDDEGRRARVRVQRPVAERARTPGAHDDVAPVRRRERQRVVAPDRPAPIDRHRHDLGAAAGRVAHERFDDRRRGARVDHVHAVSRGDAVERRHGRRDDERPVAREHGPAQGLHVGQGPPSLDHEVEVAPCGLEARLDLERTAYVALGGVEFEALEAPSFRRPAGLPSSS